MSAKKNVKDADIFGDGPAMIDPDLLSRVVALEKKVDVLAPVKPMLGGIVKFIRSLSEEPNAAIITRVKKDDVVDLSVFRQDGQTIRLYDVPKKNRVVTQGYWEVL